MKDQLTEADIQWLAQIIARIPTVGAPDDTLAKLRALDLIEETPDGWNATSQGVITVVTWGSAG